MSWSSLCGLVPSVTQKHLSTCMVRLGSQRQHCCPVTMEIGVLSCGACTQREPSYLLFLWSKSEAQYVQYHKCLFCCLCFSTFSMLRREGVRRVCVLCAQRGGGGICAADTAGSLGEWVWVQAVYLWQRQPPWGKWVFHRGLCSMRILSLSFFEVLIIDLNWPVQIFFPPSPLTISCYYLLVFLLHMTMLQVLQATKKAVVGTCWSLVILVGFPSNDMQGWLIYQHEGTWPSCKPSELP